MNTTTPLQKGILAVTIPIVLQLLLVFFVRSAWFLSQPSDLAIAVSIDFLFTAPFIYWLMIRKTNIPNTTVLPFFILSTVLASLVIPSEHQSFLINVRTWLIPVLELGVFTFVLSRVYLIFKEYHKRSNEKPDFLLALTESCEQILPKKAAAFLANEIAIFYYAFFKWKKHQPLKSEFTYHQKSGTITLFAAVLFLIAVETFALHLLLAQWNVVVAWIATGISIYSGFFILGLIKSIPRRLIKIEGQSLFIPYGLFGHCSITYEMIENIETGKITTKNNEKPISVSPLIDTESPNVKITTKRPITIKGLYGMTKKTNQLVFCVDDLGGFKQLLEEKFRINPS